MIVAPHPPQRTDERVRTTLRCCDCGKREGDGVAFSKKARKRARIVAGRNAQRCQECTAARSIRIGKPVPGAAMPGSAAQ